jgi:hypothetical protein
VEARPIWGKIREEANKKEAGTNKVKLESVMAGFDQSVVE